MKRKRYMRLPPGNHRVPLTKGGYGREIDKEGRKRLFFDVDMLTLAKLQAAAEKEFLDESGRALRIETLFGRLVILSCLVDEED